MSNFVEQVVDDLVGHEGYVNAVYKDTLGFKTLGIGHLILSKDDEHFLTEGAYVGDWAILRYFFNDTAQKISDVEKLFPDIKGYPEPVQRVLLNMMFNLGITKLSGFKKMIAAVRKNDFETAADEMVDSLWYRQVRRRGLELVALMRSAAE